jgi:hypothetical protein
MQQAQLQAPSPPSMLEQLLVILTKIQQIMVQMQHANQLMQSMVGITPSRKRKHDTQSEANPALNERTKKQHKAPKV